MHIEKVATQRCKIGESALWDDASCQLYFVDIPRQKVHRYDPVTGANTHWKAEVAPGALGLRGCGGLVVAMHDSICTLDVDNGEFNKIAGPAWEDPRRNMNDGTVSREGRFVVGCSHHELRDPEPIGGLFVLDAEHTLTQVGDGIRWSNSPCFSPDGETLYFSDSKLHTMYAYDYDAQTGGVSNRRIFATTEALGGLPDGSTVDSDGLVWMAVFGGSKIAAFKPDGTLERVVEVPVSLPSSVAFGGPNFDVLYITSIDTTMFGQPVDDASGYVYAIHDLGHRGLAEPRFVG